MAEDPRELIRTAQAAELARDFPGAEALLRRAAQLYREQGTTAQADRLVRHADRLAQGGASEGPALRFDHRGPSTGSGEIAPTGQEGTGQDATGRAGTGRVDSGRVDIDAADPGRAENRPVATEAVDTRTVLGGGHLTLFDRGPELADASIDAWCSFCCHPTSEVGRLVTGPTGSFICTDCVAQAGASLGAEGGRSAAFSLQPVGRTPETVLFPAHREAVAEIERSIAAGARRILLLGGAGVGKARVLEALRTGDLHGGLPRGAVLLTEQELLARGDAKTLRALERGAFILAARGTLHARWTVAGERELPLPTSQELAEATGTRLPFALLEAVEVVVQVRAATEPEVLETARRLLTGARPTKGVSDRLLRALVASAMSSGRPVHELEALIHRLPPGTWDLAEENS